MSIKYSNKVRLAKYIKETTQIAVNPSSLFDIQVKRIHEVNNPRAVNIKKKKKS